MMNTQKNIVGNTIKFAFKTLVDNYALFVMIIGMTIFIIIFVGFLLLRSMFLYGLLMVLLGSGFYLGLDKIALMLCDGGKPLEKVLFSCFNLVPRALMAFVLFFVMVSIGMILFVLPGIFILIRFSLFPYCIIDKNAGVIESLNMSYEITENNAWNWVCLCVLLSLISGISKLLLSSFIYLTFNLFFIVPFSALVYARFYRTLAPKNDSLREMV